MSILTKCDWCKELIDCPGVVGYARLTFAVFGGKAPGQETYHLCSKCFPEVEMSLDQEGPVK